MKIDSNQKNTAPNHGDWLKLLMFVYNNKQSSFYRNIWNDAGFNPEKDFSNLDDITKIPLLTKQQLLEAKLSELCFVPKTEVTALTTTSGTTSKKQLVTYITPSQFTKSAVAPEQERFGLGMLLFNPIRAGALTYLYHERKQPFVLGDIHNLPASCSIAAQAGVSTITTTPTLAIILKKYIDQHPALQKNLKYLRLGGEVISPEKKHFIQELYPDIEIFIVYASSEVGRTASQCSHLSKQTDEVLLHPNYESFHFEMIDNELVITDFSNLATPMIRYRTGDMVSFIEKECACSKPGPLLLFKGRVNHEVVRAGGFEIRRETLEKPLLQLHHIVTTNFNTLVTETYKNNKPFIDLKIELELQKDSLETEDMRTFIMQNLVENMRLSPTLSLQQAQATGFFGEIEIDFITFPVSAKAIQKITLEQQYD